jgi:hypothetical protein
VLISAARRLGTVNGKQCHVFQSRPVISRADVVITLLAIGTKTAMGGAYIVMA